MEPAVVVRVKKASKVLIRNRDGDILVLRRSKTHPHVPLTNDLPGGMVEEGEDFLASAIRETYEETCIRLDVTLMKDADMSDKQAYNTRYVITLYDVQLDHTPAVTLSWEHDAYSWVAPDELKLVGAGFEAMVESYLRS